MFGYLVCKRSGCSHNRIIVESMRLFPDWEDVGGYLRGQVDGGDYHVYELYHDIPPSKVHYKKVRKVVQVEHIRLKVRPEMENLVEVITKE